jgi:ketosteroid isomerase-like protein
MKRLIFAMVLVLAVSFLIFGQAKKQTAAKSTSADQELIQLEKDWSNAAIKRDVAFLDRIMTDDNVGTDYEGVVHTGKAQYLSDLKSGACTMTSQVIEDIKARVWGDAGVVWMRWTEKSQSNGKDTSGHFQGTDTWIKIDGRWQCVAGEWTKVVKK